MLGCANMSALAHMFWVLSEMPAEKFSGGPLSLTWIFFDGPEMLLRRDGPARNAWNDWCSTKVNVVSGAMFRWNFSIGSAIPNWFDHFVEFSPCFFFSLVIFPNIFWLVVLTPLKNISQLGWLSHILWKIKNVPNHQPVFEFHWYFTSISLVIVLQSLRIFTSYRRFFWKMTHGNWWVLMIYWNWLIYLFKKCWVPFDSIGNLMKSS